jgi:hypothetical protein
MVSAKNRPRPSAPRELLCHHGVWIDFSRFHGFRRESGERLRYLTLSLAIRHQTENGTLPQVR